MRIYTDDIHYKNIADAIREKGEREDTFKPSEMAGAILDIEDAFDTSMIIGGQNLFAYYGEETIDLRGLDLSGVINFSSAFEGCYDLKELDLSVVKFSRVTYISRLCRDCYDLQTLDLSSLDLTAIGSYGAENALANCSALQTVFVRSQADADELMAATGTPSGITFKNKDGTIYGVS